MKTVFTLEVKNPKIVEMCVKSLLSKYIYRNNPVAKVRTLSANKKCDAFFQQQVGK